MTKGMASTTQKAGMLPELTNVLQETEYEGASAGEDLPGKSVMLGDPLSL